jgi:hypothetical protein
LPPQNSALTSSKLETQQGLDKEYGHDVDRPKVVVQVVVRNIGVRVKRVLNGEGGSLEVVGVAVGTEECWTANGKVCMIKRLEGRHELRK